MLKWHRCSSNGKRTALLIPVLAVVVFVVVILPGMKNTETPLERAHLFCKDCGMLGLEIDELIQQVRESGLNPAEAVKLWKQTSELDAVELCLPRTEAVIEVVDE